MPAPLSDVEQALIDALPTSGEIEYDALRQQLIVAGKAELLDRYHSMRRSKKIGVRLAVDPADGVAKSYISRPATA